MLSGLLGLNAAVANSGATFVVDDTRDLVDQDAGDGLCRSVTQSLLPGHRPRDGRAAVLCVGGPSDTMQVVDPIIFVPLVLASLATTVYLPRLMTQQPVLVAA